MQVTTGESEIRIDLDLPIPPASAWVLISRPDAIADWWGSHVSLDAREGGHFREEWSRDGRPVVTNGTVLHCEPPSRLEMTWADNTWSGQSRVRFELSARAGGCRLSLVHGDWQHVHAPDRDALMAEHAEGWQLHLRALASLAREIAGEE